MKNKEKNQKLDKHYEVEVIQQKVMETTFAHLSKSL